MCCAWCHVLQRTSHGLYDVKSIYASLKSSYQTHPGHSTIQFPFNASMKNNTTTIDGNTGEEPSDPTVLSCTPTKSLSTSPPKSISTSSSKSTTTGSYVTQLTTVASFGLDIAALFTSIGFGAAKLGTELGLSIVKQSVGSIAEFFTSSQGNGEDR